MINIIMTVSNLQPQRKVEDLTDLIVPMMKVTIPVQRCKRGSVSLGEIICCFCSENDTSSNLCAAGIMHAKYEKVNKQYVEELTLKLKTMATFYWRYCGK